jgi:hypothetical protein
MRCLAAASTVAATTVAMLLYDDGSILYNNYRLLA